MTRRDSRWLPLVFCGLIAGIVHLESAQERQWAPVVEGSLAAGASNVFAIRAGAGDLVNGIITFSNIVPGGSARVEVHDASGTKIRDLSPDDPEDAVGFVAPTSGTFRIRITAVNAGRSYRLTMQRLPVATRMAATDHVAPAPRVISPRIQRLAEDVRSDRARALKTFWSEVESRKAPLFEEIAGNKLEILATIVWRATYDTRNVRIGWPYGVSEESYMSHIPDTDIWYQTVRVVRESRFPYMLAPNHRRRQRRNLAVRSLQPADELDSRLASRRAGCA